MNTFRISLALAIVVLASTLAALLPDETPSGLTQVSLAESDMERARAAVRRAVGLPTMPLLEETFFELGDGGGYLHLSRFDWDVAIALLDDEFECREVDHRVAKCGYTLRREDERTLRVTFLKHPGVGMFYEQPVTVQVMRDRLLLREGKVTDVGPEFPW